MTPDSKRGRAYVWVTWITGLLAGSDVCKWKAWYKGHFRYAKLGGGGFDLEKWKVDHDAMTTARANAERAAGRNVGVEEANAFKLEGKTSTLAGKPDLIIIEADPNEATVVDEKGGAQKPEHIWQVLIYMFALPLTRLRGFKVHGEVEYRGESVELPAERCDAGVVDKITTTMQVVGGDKEPDRTPSLKECNWCDIAQCPDRMRGDDGTGMTKSF